MMRQTIIAALAVGSLATPLLQADDDFVNWESPHVHPMDVTPSGATLLAVNTPDNRLEIFDISSGTPVWTGSIPVGLDPVSVRALSDTTAWVVNHVSDTVSIVDLGALNTVRTVPTGDEPCDVVFAQGKAFVSVSQENQVQVFHPADLDAAPSVIEIKGEDPRALATDGQRVFAAIFESGNATTIIPGETVSTNVSPYPGAPNPPPNDGDGFFPAINGGNPPPPEVALIVQRNAQDEWIDDNDGNWTPAVTWDLLDHDVAIIDAQTLDVSYQGGLMNLDMALAVRADGQVTVIGTEAMNVVRFEPNVNGVFVQSVLAEFSPDNLVAPVVVDLNPHLDYTTPTIPQNQRDLSLGDPRAIVWTADGQTGYVAGMGSNNVIIIDSIGARLGEIEVGEGPTGLMLDEASDRLYVMNKFEAAISVVDLDTEVAQEIERVPFFDPTPADITEGRPFLYDTHLTSGLGQASCASCHVDGRWDALSWDLGDPSGALKPFNQVCNFGIFGNGDCEDWHPMKGPMTTQTLVGSIETGPLHWRADREDLAAFNPAFVSLMGDDTELTQEEMAKFTDFVATLTNPPNPNRNIDGSLPSSFPNGGNPQTGQNLFMNANLDGGVLTCNFCHTVPTGTNGTVTSADAILDTQSMKIAQLRNLYEKTGLDFESFENTRGFAFTHDGAVDSLFNFLLFPDFTFAFGETGNQQRRDIVAFLMNFSTDTHAGVGAQATLASFDDLFDQGADIPTMVSLATNGEAGLVVKGVVDGEPRGFALVDGAYQSDRASETTTFDDLLLAAAPGEELTFTLVPAGSETRVGLDRDRDGFFDRDEIDVCSDPADPHLFPGSAGSIDVNGDLQLDVFDFVDFQAAFQDQQPAGDCNVDGEFTIFDFVCFQSAFQSCP